MGRLTPKRIDPLLHSCHVFWANTNVVHSIAESLKFIKLASINNLRFAGRRFKFCRINGVIAPEFTKRLPISVIPAC